MNRHVKESLTILIAFVLFAVMIPAQAVFAAGTDDNDTVIEEIAKQLADRSKDPFAFRDGAKAGKKLKLSAETDMPQFDLSAKFMEDGDETSYVTPVKFQNPFGSCWGFAAIAAAETSIIGDGIAPGYAAQADPDNNIKELDLSEKHVINFLVTPLNDPSNPQNGEGMYFVKKNLKLADKFDMGGLSIFATNLFASGMGPDREDREVPEGLAEDIFEYKGLEGSVEQRKVDGKYQDYCYSADDDWSMPEDLRFKQSYTLEESYLLPSPAKRIPVDESEQEFEYEYDPKGTQAIKEQLVNKRAVSIGFCADTSMPDQEEVTQYLSDQWAHYTYRVDDANHAVTIVGWDDNYDRNNFSHETIIEDEDGNQSVEEAPLPPEDGAWLVKNSWGSGERDFPNKGPGSWGIIDEETGKHTGYFWLSYYDQSLSTPEALKFTDEVPTEGYYLDQHDYMPVSQIETVDLPDKLSMSNVFRAEDNQKLDYFSCQTSAPETTVEYEVYLLQPKYKNPQDGVRVAHDVTEPFEYGGFHKIPVNDDVVIQKGQYYSIIVTQKTPVGEYNFNLQTGDTKEMAELFGSPCWEKGVINPKESFLNINETWYDFTDPDFQDKMLEGLQYMMSIDNFPIKGYCSKLKNPDMYLAGGNNVNLPPYLIEWASYSVIKKDIVLRFRKRTGVKMPEEPVIEWKIAEGSEEIFEMTPDEKDEARVIVRALKPGTGYLTVSAKGEVDGEEINIGTQVIRIDVPKKGWYDVWDVGDLEYGNTERVAISNLDDTPIPAGTFTYKSDNKKVATVSAKGLIRAVGTGKTIIRASDKNGVEEQIKVRVIKASQKMKVKGKKFTIKAEKLKKKAQTVKRTKLITVKNYEGKLSFIKKKGSSKITIKKGGKVTLKKGLKKGVYKVKVQVRASGNKNYKKQKKNVTFTVIVK